MNNKAFVLAMALTLGSLLACSGTSTSNLRDGSSADGVDAISDTITRDGVSPPHDGPRGDLGPAQRCEVLPATFADGKSPDPNRTIHVSPSGNDETATGTPGSPYGSLSAAALDDRVEPGWAIAVHEGTYTEGASVENLVGSADAPIWIGGAQGEDQPHFEGRGIVLSRVRYVVVHDLHISSAEDSGINCDDGEDYANADATRHVVFQGLNIHDISGDGTQDCIRLSGVDDYFVLDNDLQRCGSGVDQVGCHGGHVVGNRIFDMVSNAVQAKGGSDDIEIRANRIGDPGLRGLNLGGHSELDDFRPPLSTTGANVEASNLRAIANLIKGGEAGVAFVGCVDCLAANNTIIDPTRFPLRVLQESVSSGGWTFTPCSRGRVVNNIIVYTVDTIEAHLNVGDDTSADTFSFSHNLWYGRDYPAFSQPRGLPVTETEGVYGKDPAFIDELMGDFGIDATSGAAFAGVSLDELGADFQGLCFRVPPSVGAFEVP